MPCLPSQGNPLQEIGCAKEDLGSVVPFGLGQLLPAIDSSWASNVDALVRSKWSEIALKPRSGDIND